MAALPSSTANWHWKTKHVSPWARTWFERELVTLKVTGQGEEAVEVSSITEFEGDVELGRRKSKLITIYDVKIELLWKGVANDGTQVAGSLTIPEVSHENTIDGVSDFTYEWKLSTKSSPAVEALLKLAKSNLPTVLEAKFREFPQAILDTHGKDILVGGTPDDSRTGTPAPATSATPAAASSTSSTTTKTTATNNAATKKAINTATVKVEGRFMAAADDLFNLLTDEKRIPAWSRAPAQSNPTVGSSYSLFGGGVKGTFTVVEAPKRFEQTWALSSPSWPDDHLATLVTELDQQTDSTKITFSLKGVPRGMEEEIERNLEGYYIRGLKSIGYVQVENYSPIKSTSSPSRTSKDHPAKALKSPGWNAFVGLFFAGLVLTMSFVAPLLFKKPS